MRKLALLVVLAACAKSAQKDGAKQASEPAATETAPAPTAVAPPPPTSDEGQGGAVGGAAPGGPTTGAEPPKKPDPKDQARASGVLGPTDQDLFKPLEPERAKGGGAGDRVAFVAKIEQGPIGSLAKDVQACYDKALAKKPGLVGELEIKFTYKADGTTGDVAIAKSTLGHAELEACVVGVLETAKLAPAKGTGKTRARIVFKKQ